LTLNKDVIGYAMAEHIRAQLVTGALEMAGAQPPARRRLHYAFRPRLPNICLANIPPPSPSSSCGNRWATPGYCWDNALAESFFASLKNERVPPHGVSDPEESEGGYA